MPEETKEVPKKKADKKVAKTEATSVRSYKNDTEAEKQTMSAYSKKFGSTVRGLQSNFKKYTKDVRVAASALREEGIKNMSNKINKFKGDIEDQIKENKAAVTKISNGVKFFLSEINKKKKDFKAYAYTFWG